MAWIPAAVAGGSALVGGLMNASSASGANATNERIAQEEMAWQTQMSNTAEQRHVADLTAAGLNPALAYQTAAPVPGSAPIANVQPTNPGSGIMNAGSAVAQNMLQSKMQQAQIDQVTAQADKARAETATTLATNPYAGATAQQSLENLFQTESVIKAQADNLYQNWNITGNMNQYRMQQLQQDTAFQKAMQPIQLAIEKANFQRLQLGMPRLENDASMQNSWFGKNVVPLIGPVSQMIDTGVHAASGLSGAASAIGDFVPGAKFRPSWP